MNRQTLSQGLKAIWNLDLEPIVYKLVHKEDGKGWPLERADTAAHQYRQFLELNLRYPKRSIVPTKDIDEVWHAHILDTAKYREDCDRIFGRFLDHFPYFGVRSNEDAQNLKAAFEETKNLFARHFGKATTAQPAICEKKASACGSSCGSSLCDNNACDSNSCKPEIEVVRPRVDRTSVLAS